MEVKDIHIASFVIYFETFLFLPNKVAISSPLGQPPSHKSSAFQLVIIIMAPSVSDVKKLASSKSLNYNTRKLELRQKEGQFRFSN